VEDAPEVDSKETTARFYFALTYQLAKEDITRFEEVEKTNLYLCLSAAALIKERFLKEKEEMRKIEAKYQMK